MNQSAPTPQGTAALYRMLMSGHVCPHGIKSKWLIEPQGCRVDDQHLETREQTDAFREEHDVETKPQPLIGSAATPSFHEWIIGGDASAGAS